MKNLFIILFSILLVSSCQKDDTISNNSMQESEISLRSSGDSERPCRLRVELIGTDENGCCIYKLSYTPRLRGNYTLHGNGQVYNGQVSLKGTYQWTITTCEDLKVCLIHTTLENQTSQIVCCTTLTCDVTVDCNIDVTIEDNGVDNRGNCKIKICIDQRTDSKSLYCDYSLYVDGVQQVEPFRCCWNIVVPSGETVVIEIRNSKGQICYTEEYTCDYDCCREGIDWDLCFVGDSGSPDCRIFQVSLSSSSEQCVGDYIVSHVGYKTGTATLLNPNTGSIEVCINHQTQNYNVGLNVYFETENCGTSSTGFFYPWQELNNGNVDECNW